MKRCLLCLFLVLIFINSIFPSPSDSMTKSNGVIISYVGNLPKQFAGLNLFFLRGIYLTVKWAPINFWSYENISGYEQLYFQDDIWIYEKRRWETIGLGFLKSLKKDTFIYAGLGSVFGTNYRFYYDPLHILTENGKYATVVRKRTLLNANAGFLFCLTSDGPRGVYLIVGGNSNPRGVDIGLGLKFR